MKAPKIWGDWFVSTQAVPELPNVDHIVGSRVEYGPDGKPEKVRIQYQSARGHHELAMDFLNAMFLLSNLKSIQLDEKYPFPDDPRAPSAK